MDSLIEKFITTGGSLVAFVIVVYFMVNVISATNKAFLAHMASQAELNRQMHREMHTDNITSKRESHAALEKLSDAVTRLNFNVEKWSRVV